ncbi:MAG: MFS transporter [Deltaproteobacteria bacterium]|jgi:sugar phosphate permease|nr:MFS transporter [Deltaproteobacteria bacterium]
MNQIALSNSHSETSAYRWVILSLSVTCFVMAFVARFSWPPLMPVIMPIMKVDFTQAMAYMTAFYIGYVLTQIPGGLMADRFGPRLVLGAALLLQAFGVFAMGLTQNYYIGFAFRVVCGLGAGCVYSSSLKAIVSWFSPAQRGLAIGILMTAPTVGVAIPNYLMPALNLSLGWQGAFKVVGAAIAVVAILTVIFARSPVSVASSRRKSFLESLKFVLKNRNIILMALAGFSIVWCQIGFGSVINTYLVSNLKLNEVKAGELVAFYGLAGILMPACAGYFCGVFPHRKTRLIIISHLALAAALVAFGYIKLWHEALYLIIIIGLLVSFANPLSTIIIADNAGPEWAGAAGGVANCIFQFGALLSPLAIGLTMDMIGTHALTFIILGVGSLLGVMAAILAKDM